jgi:hypothetical protein
VNNNKVIDLPASTNYSPEQALNSALKADLTDVMVIGYDQDGDLFVRSSRMTRAEGLFMVKRAEDWTMNGGRDND